MARSIATGSAAVVQVNGVNVGFASGIRISINQSIQDIEVLGNIEDEEHVVNRYKVTGSLDRFHVLANSFESLGFYPEVGDGKSTHLANALNQAPLVLQVIDEVTGDVLHIVESLIFENVDFQFNANSASTVSATFKAKRSRQVGDQQ